MKKFFTLSVIILCGIIASTIPSFADDAAKNYIVNETFDGLSNYPSGWAIVSNGAYGRSGTVTFASDVLTLTGSGSGNRGSEISFTSTGTDSVAYVEFDWTITSAMVGNKNMFCLYLLGANSTNVASSTASDVYVDAILGLYLSGSDAKVHCWNKDISFELRTDSVPVLVSGQYPSFRRAGSTVALCNDSNASTITDVAYTAKMTYHISAKLDFTNKKVVSLTIAEKDNDTNGQTLTDLPFISSSVTELSILGVVNTKSSSQGNGSSTSYTTVIDNFQVYDYGVLSSIESQSAAKTLKSVEYYNLSGIKSDKSQKGFLIQVNKYTDGSTSTSKILVE